MNCRSCKSETTDLLSLGEHGLPPYGEGKTYPLQLVKCTQCHLVQLKETVPQELMYNDSYGYRSGINETIKADLKDIVEKALELMPNALQVTDVGANDGTLLSYYPEHIELVAYEPVEKFHEGLRKLGANVYPYMKKGYPGADIVTAISMFYDVEEMDQFVWSLSQSIHDKGLIIIQQNYLLRMLENTAFDNICHEHLTYFCLTSLEPLLERHGLEVFRAEENPINGGSFRTYICHKGQRDVEPSVAEMRKQEQHLSEERVYTDFANRIKERCEELRNSLAGRVYAYGASTRGAILLKTAGVADKIEAVVERNPDKIGKTYLGIPIISEADATPAPDTALILPWFHPSIIQREKELTRTGTKIVLPLPEVCTYTHQDLYPAEHL